ncbi:class E sortase [Spelaeicoccus albus]|uniref:LPXTG-site transpeptidase (Sortase) family protein n=1 Tax=Spelaeicoccus albus TaxID=1280376 RepID=A0A7Z0A8Z9_9MICO|nr:class E sortase [Spelaeicoccus albus]NYI66604.1 LPXTG-site transpeptidase (sortase) family protein [Spelaeicoccus albus]
MPGRRSHTAREKIGPVRFGIQAFGEICITLGIILLLFVAWQLWWTDIGANKNNTRLAHSLAEKWHRDGTQPDAAAPPVQDDSAGNLGKLPAVKEPDFATAFGIMYVPRFGNDYYRTIAEGTALNPVLDEMGLGHYEGTAMPGRRGNFAVAGHRTTYGKPLNKIADLHPGDKIVVETKAGWYTYTFRNFNIVLPDHVSVVGPVPDAPTMKPTDRFMTLTACNPMYSARERYIAYAVLTGWSSASHGPPKTIAGTPAYRKAHS